MDAPLQQSISPKEAQKVVNNLGDTLAKMLGLISAGRRGEVEQKLAAVRAAAVPGRLVHSQLEELDILVIALQVSLADSLVEVGTLSKRAVAYSAKAVTAMAELEVENRRGNELELKNAELQTQQRAYVQLSDDVIQQLVDISPGWTMNFDETVRPITWTWEWTDPDEAETVAPSIGLDSLPVTALDRVSLAAGLTKKTGRSLFAVLGPKMLERIAPKVFQTVEMSEANVEQIASFFSAKAGEPRGDGRVPELVGTRIVVLRRDASQHDPTATLASLLPTPILAKLLSGPPLLFNELRLRFTDFAVDSGFWLDIWPFLHPVGLTLARVRSDKTVVTVPSITVVPPSAIVTVSERTEQLHFLGEESVPVVVDATTGERTIAIVSASGEAPDKFRIVRVPKGEAGAQRATRSKWFGPDRVWARLDGLVLGDDDAWVGLGAGWSSDDVEGEMISVEQTETPQLTWYPSFDELLRARATSDGGDESGGEDASGDEGASGHEDDR